MADGVEVQLPQFKIQAHADLIKAVLDDDIPGINKAVAMGASINKPDAQGRQALQLAAGRGNLDAVNRLLYHAADARAKGGDGHGAIYAAAAAGHEHVIKRLLMWDGSDAEELEAAALVAVEKQHIRVCSFILKKLCNVDENKCSSVLQQLQRDPATAQRLDQTIMECWVADVNGHEQAAAELAEHQKAVEVQQQDVQRLLVHVAELARSHVTGATAGAGHKGRKQARQ